jgi:ribosomal protein L16 Arg81 hydroxylase
MAEAIVEIERRVRHIEQVVVELQTGERAREKALDNQAEEYERRLQILNNEHSRIQDILGKSVTQERFEEYVKTERDARELALQRTQERLDDFISRYEENHRILEKQVDAQRVAALTVTAEQAKAFNRSVALATLALTIVVIVINVLLS